MVNGVERRAARRFSMMLPLRVRFSAGNGITEKAGETRDVSFRGLYFTIEANLESGSSIEFVTAGYAEKLPPLKTPLPGVYLATMAHVYPQDRGQNYSMALGERTAEMMLAANRASTEPAPA